MKSTAIAPANIAFIKYWGRTNDELILPANSSISMNLSNCTTTTTVEFDPALHEDSISVSYYKQEKQMFDGKKKERVVKQLDRMRKKAGTKDFARVESINSFPADSGIASSASAFAALTLAATNALGLSLDEKELSILTRLSGSGSACRSIPDGFVYWEKGETSEDSYASSLFPTDHWSLVDLVAVVGNEGKTIGSAQGHLLAWTSDYYKSRLEILPKRIEKVKQALREKDIASLGEAIEEETISEHVVMMTSKPPLFYWTGRTIELIQSIRKWRNEGVQSYFCIDAGANVHVICEENQLKAVEKRLADLGIHEIIRNTPAVGARVIDKHLF